jgi:hypothetical protein
LFPNKGEALRKVGTASTRKPLLLFRKKRKGCAKLVQLQLESLCYYLERKDKAAQSWYSFN